MPTNPLSIENRAWPWALRYYPSRKASRGAHHSIFLRKTRWATNVEGTGGDINYLFCIFYFLKLITYKEAPYGGL